MKRTRSLVVFSGVFLRPGQWQIRSLETRGLVALECPGTWTSLALRARQNNFNFYRFSSCTAEPQHVFGGSNNHEEKYGCPGST